MARILIVEDESLISMMLEEWLVEMGHVVMGPAASVKEALALIEAEKPDAAILDLNLQGQRADAVGDALLEKYIPYAFATGDSAGSVDPRFAGQPVVGKPYDYNEVKKVVVALVDRRAAIA